MSKVSLKAARVNAGLTLKEVSEKTNISEYTLSKYEKGKSVPRWDTFVMLCSVYNQACTDIFLPKK